MIVLVPVPFLKLSEEAFIGGPPTIADSMEFFISTYITQHRQENPSMKKDGVFAFYLTTLLVSGFLGPY